jgi:hypothetical protein
MLRDFFSQHRLQAVDYSQAEAMVIKKGFTTLQLEKCLTEYQALGVLRVDKDKTTITFEPLDEEGL